MRDWFAGLVLLAAAPLLILAVEGGDNPPPPLPAPVLDPELGVPIGAPLRSMATDLSPVMDGMVEAEWEQAPLLTVPLHYGLHGDEQAGALELRSLHDAGHVYFLARWPAETSGGEPDTWRNLMTIHWRLVDPGQVSGEATGSDGLACTVGCHTATVDGQGRLVGIRPETIPPGSSEDLPSGGGWSDGEWRLEWSRPKISDSPYDQSLADPEQGYRFFVKLFLGWEGQPDPVSNIHELRLSR
jgi:hypothetical protein